MRLLLFSLASVAPVLFFQQMAHAEELYVTPGGSDLAAGTQSSPWKTLQHAADQALPGDVVHVSAGTYQGFEITRSGTALAPIEFRAEPGAVIVGDNESTPDGINIEGGSHVTLDGFEVRSASRAGVRVALADFVTIRRVRADENGTWGIFSSHANDLLIEDCETSRSQTQHGIYVSNSGDRPVLRRNHSWGNSRAGIHMNGDSSYGGDGVISDALVEGNRIHDNGATGASGINCDGVQDSVFRNNVLYDNLATGIALYRIDGGAGSSGNLIVNNTIVMPMGSRWAVLVRDGSTNNRVLNNILVHADPSKGAIDLGADCSSGFASDYNVVADRLTSGSGTVSLATWTATTQFDAHSQVLSESELFLDPDAGDFRLAAGSPAIDSGDPDQAPPVDHVGVARPSGAGVDIGAFERPVEDSDPSDDKSDAPDEPGGESPDAEGPPDRATAGCSTAGGSPARLAWWLVPLLLLAWTRGSKRREILRM